MLLKNKNASQRKNNPTGSVKPQKAESKHLTFLGAKVRLVKMFFTVEGQSAKYLKFILNSYILVFKSSTM